jgi:hypothetical protein
MPRFDDQFDVNTDDEDVQKGCGCVTLGGLAFLGIIAIIWAVAFAYRYATQ